MKEVPAETFQPEMLLAHLDDSLKGVVSEILVAVPTCLPEQAEQTAGEMLSWLEKFSMQKKKESLVTQIQQAQHENNPTLSLYCLH